MEWFQSVLEFELANSNGPNTCHVFQQQKNSLLVCMLRVSLLCPARLLLCCAESPPIDVTRLASKILQLPENVLCPGEKRRELRNQYLGQEVDDSEQKTNHVEYVVGPAEVRQY